MALVAGSKRAALIDTGCGVGDLKEVVSGLTKLPVTVLTTHVHLDHVGGHPLFDTDGQESEIYASPLEMREWKESGMEAASLKQRMDFLRAAVEGDEERYQKFAKSIVREGYFAYRPLTDGMTIDLGGVSLTACMVPGHTKESFVFVDMERGDAFAGDSINPTPWIFPGVGNECGRIRTCGGTVPEEISGSTPSVQRTLYGGYRRRDHRGYPAVREGNPCGSEGSAGKILPGRGFGASNRRRGDAVSEERSLIYVLGRIDGTGFSEGGKGDAGVRNPHGRCGKARRSSAFGGRI